MEGTNLQGFCERSVYVRWYRQAGRNPICVGFCLQGEGGREVVKVKGNFFLSLSGVRE